MSSEKKNYYHRIAVTSTLDATDATTAALVVAGGAALGGSLYLGGQLNASAGLELSGTTPSTGTSVGAMVLVGGLAIGTTEDAASYTSGGSLTLAGGAAVGGRLLVTGTVATRTGLVLSTAPASSTGGSLTFSMAGQSGTLSASDPSTYTLHVTSADQLDLSSTNASSLTKTLLRVDHASATPVLLRSKQSAVMIPITPNREDTISEQTMVSSVDVVSTPANVTGLVFTTSGAFLCYLHVVVDATTPLSSMYELRGLRLGNGSWQLMQDQYLGDAVPIAFSIDSSGQVQYTKSSTSGHVSTTMAWRVTSLFDI